MNSSPTWRLHLIGAGLLFLLTLAAGLPGIQGLALARGDEKFYIQWAHHMSETGNYFVPVHDGDLNLAKPPLYYWLAAASCRLFGLTLFSFRFPSLLAAGLAVVLVYAWTYSLYNDARAARCAGLAMASSYTTYWHSKLALTDMVMTLGILAGAFFFLRGALSGRRPLNFLLSSIGVGIAGMAKGHVGAVLAALPILTFVALDRGSSGRVPLRDLLAPGTWLPAIVLSGWWYFYLATCDRPAIEFAPNHPRPDQTLSQAFVDFFRAEEIEGRPSGGWHGLVKNLGYYPLAYLRMFFPWSLFVLAGFFLGPRVLRLDWREKPRETRMLLALIVPIFLLFTVVIRQQARSRYLLPMAPAVAILAARYFMHRGRESQQEKRWMPRPPAVAVGLLLIYNLVFVGFVPAVRGQPLERLCDQLRTRLQPDDQLWVAGMHTKWHTYAMALLGRPVRFLGPELLPPALTRAIEEAGGPGPAAPAAAVYLIIPEETWRALPPDALARLDRLGEAFGFEDEIKLKDLRLLLAGPEAAPPENRWHLVLLRLGAPSRSFSQSDRLPHPPLRFGACPHNPLAAKLRKIMG